jgi:ABC-type dipeptide/oligopeptide/nickel transport system ATPase component
VPRYFLTRIRVEGFRGINNEADPLDLRFRLDAVNSVFAVNGIGKSSLFEALSYAIRGSIPKLDSLQAQEHPGDYYCNRFHSRNHATIDLEFQPDDGTSPTIGIQVERSSAGVRKVTSPSGYPAPDAFLASLNADFALLDHRTFARFIDDSPLDRGRSFSALLGLSSYSDMRQSLQAACDTRAFNGDFDVSAVATAIRNAQQSSQQALISIRTNYERVIGTPLKDVTKLDDCMQQVATALGAVPLLKAHFQGKPLAEVDFNAVKKAIRDEEGGEKRKELEKVIEAITKLETIGAPDDTGFATEQTSLATLITERDALLATTRGDLFKRLYDTADSLVTQGVWADDKTCPLCLNLLDASLKEHIDGQLDQYRGVAQKISEIKELGRSCQWCRRLALLEKSESLAIDERERISTKFSQQLANGSVTADNVVTAKSRLSALELSATSKLNELIKKKEQIEKELPLSLVQLTEQVEYSRQFKDSVHTYKEKQKEEAMHRSCSDIRERWRRFIDKATSSFSEAEEALSKAKIGAIDKEYKAMFKQIMNVGDVVPDLLRASDREDLHVQLRDFHGQHKLSARALLSESYRNALAISVFLAAALQDTSAPRFVVLDDVTSSFDSGHQYALMELIRNKQHPRNATGLQFLILSHDGLLQKYFDRLDGTGDWRHHTLQGSPPMGAILIQSQDANRLKGTIDTLLNAGQVTQAEPLVRQYLEYKLQQIIRKVAIPVPVDFAMKDQAQMVSNCIDAITDCVELHRKAGTLVLDQQQVTDLETVHVPALVGNWVSHYATGSGSSFSAPMLKGIITTIDTLADCFCFNHISGGATSRKWCKSLSSKQ